MLHIRGIPIIRISRRRVLSRASICSARSRCVAMKRRMLTRIGALAARQCYATAAFIPANWFVQRILSPYLTLYVSNGFTFIRVIRCYKPPFLFPLKVSSRSTKIPFVSFSRVPRHRIKLIDCAFFEEGMKERKGRREFIAKMTSE